MSQALGQVVIVTIKDGRRFYGRWCGVDSKKTILLDDVLEELPAGGMSKVADQIESIDKYTSPLDVSRYASAYIDFSFEPDEEKRKKLQKEFLDNKLRHQAVVIPGDSIAKIELQKVIKKANPDAGPTN